MKVWCILVLLFFFGNLHALQYDVSFPSRLRVGQEGKGEVRLTVPSSEDVVISGLLPPKDTKNLAFRAGPLVVQEKSKERVYIYSFTIQGMEKGKVQGQHFTLNYYPSGSDPSQAEPSTRTIPIPTVEVRPAYWWKNRKVWSNSLDLLLLLALLSFVFRYFWKKRRFAVHGS